MVRRKDLAEIRKYCKQHNVLPWQFIAMLMDCYYSQILNSMASLESLKQFLNLEGYELETSFEVEPCSIAKPVQTSVELAPLGLVSEKQLTIESEPLGLVSEKVISIPVEIPKVKQQ